MRKSNTMDILVCRRRLRLYDRQITGTVTVVGIKSRPRKSPPFHLDITYYSNSAGRGLCPAQSAWPLTRRRGMRWLNEDRHGRRSRAKRRTSTNFYMTGILSGNTTIVPTPYMLGWTDSQQLIAHRVCRVSALMTRSFRCMILLLWACLSLKGETSWSADTSIISNDHEVGTQSMEYVQC